MWTYAGIAILTLASCGRQAEVDQSTTANGSNIVVGDEAPSNGADAPASVSGSGETPPIANNMNARNASENSHAAE
ncbi:hypothetical protein C1T17_03900 [Sphingobium sp. SCG-1]|nr:hypothetical protein C1T17_03900 [Sphingobium sp. SCG-1]